MISLDDLYERDGGVCQIGKHLIERDEATRDHIRPRSKGGRSTSGNLQLACGPCNVAKGSKFERPEFQPSRKRLRVPQSKWDFLPEYGPVGSHERSVL